MPSGIVLDRHLLHIMLWQARDRLGRVKIHQRELAKSLGISFTHLCGVISDFKKAELLEKVGAKERNVGIYRVQEPSSDADREGVEIPYGIGPANAKIISTRK